MTGDKRYISKIDNTVTGKVRFGDDSCIDIKGKKVHHIFCRNEWRAEEDD